LTVFSLSSQVSVHFRVMDKEVGSIQQGRWLLCIEWYVFDQFEPKPRKILCVELICHGVNKIMMMMMMIVIIIIIISWTNVGLTALHSLNVWLVDIFV
jgi:hypothetical protein